MISNVTVTQWLQHWLVLREVINVRPFCGPHSASQLTAPTLACFFGSHCAALPRATQYLPTIPLEMTHIHFQI